MQAYNVSIYFKFARTSTTKFYEINLNWSINEFINIMNALIDQDFGKDRVEFVKTMQNTHNMASEDAPAISPSDIPLREIFAEDVATNSLAFYIRDRTPYNVTN
jgi:hypothetical protein